MPDACKDRWVCTRKWRDPQLDDSGRLACSMQRCLGDDPFEANFLLRFFRASLLVTSRCLDRDLDIHNGGHETRVTEALMHH